MPGAAYALTVAACLALLGACARFETLERDLGQPDQTGVAVVQVVNHSGRTSPHLVMLIDVDSLRVVQLERLRGSGEARLRAWPGRYYVAGFEDRNANLRHDPGEPAALFGAPDVIALGDGLPDARLTLELSDDAPDPAVLYPELVARIDAANADLVFNNIGVVATLDDPRFDAANGELGMWQPTTFIRRELTGLYMLEPHRPGRVPVVFVHGIGGSPRQFSELLRALDPRRHEAWVFFYPSAFHLSDLAQYLHKSLSLMTAQHHLDRVLLVAHSMGGLVALQTAGLAARQGADYVPELLVTLASPFGGLSSAQLGVDHAPTVMPSWKDLVPGSPFLEQLWQHPPGTLTHVLFFAYRRSGVLAPSGDGVVPLSSQLVPAAQAHARRLVGFDASHVGLLSDPGTVEALRAVLAAH